MRELLRKAPIRIVYKSSVKVGAKPWTEVRNHTTRRHPLLQALEIQAPGIFPSSLKHSHHCTLEGLIGYLVYIDDFGGATKKLVDCARRRYIG